MPFPLDGKNKALYEMKRGFRLIFQVGGPAFLRSAALFPVIRYNKFRKKKRHGLQKSGRMKLRHAILKGDNKPCPKRLYS